MTAFLVEIWNKVKLSIDSAWVENRYLPWTDLIQGFSQMARASFKSVHNKVRLQTNKSISRILQTYYTIVNRWLSRNLLSTNLYQCSVIWQYDCIIQSEFSNIDVLLCLPFRRAVLAVAAGRTRCWRGAAAGRRHFENRRVPDSQSEVEETRLLECRHRHSPYVRITSKICSLRAITIAVLTFLNIPYSNNKLWVCSNRIETLIFW